MAKRTFLKNTVAAAGLVLGCQAAAWAQVITYVPDTTNPVPTLSQWGMIVLSVLMAAGAIHMGRKSGHRILSAILCLGALALGVGVEQSLMSNANAVGAGMISGGGGSVDLTGYPILTDIPVAGNATVNMRIVGVSAPSAATILLPTCAVGVVVPANGTCYYRISAD